MNIGRQVEMNWFDLTCITELIIKFIDFSWLNFVQVPTKFEKSR